MPRPHCLDTLWVENFEKIALSHMVTEIEANLCFCIFGKNSKWPPVLGTGKFFENCQEYINYLDTLWVENFKFSHCLGRHIYVFCCVAITQEVKAITFNNNTKQVIDPINLHTKFYKDELNIFLLKE